MGVHLSQWRASIGSFNLKMKPVRKKKPKEKMYSKEGTIKYKRLLTSSTILRFVLLMTVISALRSCVNVVSMWDESNSPDTDSFLHSVSNRIEEENCLITAAGCVIKMLLLLAGVERNPGPTIFRAVLLTTPLSMKDTEDDTVLTPWMIVCSDRTLESKVMVENFSSFSPWFGTMTSECSFCSACPKVIYLNFILNLFINLRLYIFLT